MAPEILQKTQLFYPREKNPKESNDALKPLRKELSPPSHLVEILTADDPKAWLLRRSGIKNQEKLHDHVIPEIKPP